MQGTADKDEEIRRLQSELQKALQDLEQNARLLEQFQSSAIDHKSDTGKKVLSRNIMKKLQKLDQLKQDLLEREEMLTDRDRQVKFSPNFYLFVYIFKMLPSTIFVFSLLFVTHYLHCNYLY